MLAALSVLQTKKRCRLVLDPEYDVICYALTTVMVIGPVSAKRVLCGFIFHPRYRRYRRSQILENFDLYS